MRDIFARLRKRTIRAETNPMDRCTVFSIYPFEVLEKNFTVDPGTFKIAAGSFDKPALTIVEPSSWWKEFDPDEPLVEIPISSIVMAKGWVDDWMKGIFECNMATKMPGLFFMMGRWTLEDALADKTFNAMRSEAKIKQDNWYNELIQQADVLWARTNGNPLAVPLDAKRAATALGVDNIKDWMKNTQLASLVKCIACGNLRNPEFPICPNCNRVIDKAKAAELKIV